MKSGPVRSQGGRARFVFVEGGLNVTPLRIDETRARDPRQGFIRFDGRERAELSPVSSVWARLTISGPDGSKVFRAGIRCPRDQADQLLTTIDELIRGRAAARGSAPPTE